MTSVFLFLCVSPAFGQFSWTHPLNYGGSISTKVYSNVDVIVVTGTAASDRVEVVNVGRSALVKLYSNERLVQQKWVQNNDRVPTLPGNRIPGQTLGRELWLQCRLLGGNDHFKCSSNLFDLVEVNGGSGDDVIEAGPSITYAFGDDGDDQLFGGSQSDFLSGDAGSDFVIGGKGNDWISGGPGTDFLSAIGDGGTDGADRVLPNYWWDEGNGDDGAEDYFWADTTDMINARSGDVGVVRNFGN
jgi:hypothetical protein